MQFHLASEQKSENSPNQWKQFLQSLLHRETLPSVNSSETLPLARDLDLADTAPHF